MAQICGGMEEAVERAQERLQCGDFGGAREVIVKAQQLYPGLHNVRQMLALCDVHCVAQSTVDGSDTDWYGILQLQPTADHASIRKQYRKLALLLHPDKNSFCGAEAAFKLVAEAVAVLSDHKKRHKHDMRRTRTQRAANATPKSSNQTHSPNTHPTFWTFCPSCLTVYHFRRRYEYKYIVCHNCESFFKARDLFGASSVPRQQGGTPSDGSPRRTNVPREAEAEEETACKQQPMHEKTKKEEQNLQPDSRTPLGKGSAPEKSTSIPPVGKAVSITRSSENMTLRAFKMVIVVIIISIFICGIL